MDHRSIRHIFSSALVVAFAACAPASGVEDAGDGAQLGDGIASDGQSTIDGTATDGAASDGAATDSALPDDSASMADASAMDAALEAGARDGAIEGGSDAAADAGLSGPNVDRRMPQLYSYMFRPSDADPMATTVNATQLAYLDTRVAPQGRLVVYLHGAGTPTTCGSTAHGQLLASWGFHVISPCYESNYGVGNCGNDIAGCRLEAFDGVDHHPFVNITPPNAIERRVVKAIELLQRRNPQGDWQYFLQGGSPRWDRIVISGISHGGSSTGVIAQVRPVERAVMLSGPLDSGQAWLTRTGMSAPEKFWGFSHTADSQHMGHLAAFASLMVPGRPTSVDTGASPWAGTHRLITSAMTTDGHGSTQAGGSSPRDAMGRYRFEPVWRLMYGVR